MPKQAHLLPRWSYRAAVLSPHSNLPPTVRLVLVALDGYRSDKSPVPFPSQQTLAADTGLAERTVRDALAQAEEHGWCQRTPRYREDGRGGRLNDGYELRIPDGIPARTAGKGKGVTGNPRRRLPAAGAGELSIEQSRRTELTIPLMRKHNEPTTRRGGSEAVGSILERLPLTRSRPDTSLGERYDIG